MELRLTPDRIQPAEYVRGIFAVTVPPDTRHEDLLNPSYWAHVSIKFQPGSRIEATAEDSTWFAEYFIVSCGRNWAKVSLLRFHELAESTADEIEPSYKVAWSGQIKKFRIIRIADKEEMKAGFATKADAMAWLADYEKTVEGV